MDNQKKSSKDTLGDRMKGYENAYRFYLPRRMPVIIRIDGRAFHTFTRGLQKPFDSRFVEIKDLDVHEMIAAIGMFEKEELNGKKGDGFAIRDVIKDNSKMVEINYESIPQQDHKKWK